MLLLVTPLSTKVLELPLEVGMTLVGSHRVCMAKALSSPAPTLHVSGNGPSVAPMKKYFPDGNTYPEANIIIPAIY